MSEFYQNEPQLEIRNREPNITVVPTCPYCKREIMAGAAFCPYCSARLDQPIRQNEPNPYQQSGAQQYTQNTGGYATQQQYQQGNTGAYGTPPPYPQNNANGYNGQQFAQNNTGGYGGAQYQQQNTGYGAQQYQQQYIPQPQKVDLNKHDQRPYYEQPAPAPDVRTVNEPYDYSRQDGLFSPQSFDTAQVPFTGPVQPNVPAPKMRNKWIYFVLTLILGMFGAHNFYENKPVKGALWYLPAIPLIIGVASEIMNVDSDDWAAVFAIMLLFNGVRYLVSLVKAIIRLINTQGDEYPLI